MQHLVNCHPQNGTIRTREPVYRPLEGKLRQQSVDLVAFTPHAFAQGMKERTFPLRDLGRHAINHSRHWLSADVGLEEDPQG
ncbi:MAG: hypothetical protein AUH31_04120 [Armatimonadetes bacterium 13_1_40CM_64_14]|nr:MAG: hypothetical protein AUH31_04120 [Armatimonadetes bacterium 13_1_40CM_64_14]